MHEKWLKFLKYVVLLVSIPIVLYVGLNSKGSVSSDALVSIIREIVGLLH